MDKGDIIFLITSILFTIAWFVIFKTFAIEYYVVLAIYVGAFALILYCIDLKKLNNSKLNKK